MDCYRHPGTASTATCVACAQPICQECREDVAGHPICHSCVAAASARLSDAPPAIPEPGSVEPATAPWLADAPAASGVYSPPASQLAPAPHEASKEFGAAPGIARRVGRGVFWGIVYGQWWTLLNIFWSFAWGHGGVSFGVGLQMVIFYGFFGCLAGVIIGAANMPLGRGAIVGVSVGILVWLLEMALSGDTGGLINIFFYFFTGRFVGAGITWRVQQPVRVNPGAYSG